MTIYRILGRKGRITIPIEYRQAMDLKYNDVISFTMSEDMQSVTVKKEHICNNCADEPFTDNEEKMTLFDFLNELSPEQQRAALVHLSVKWAQSKGEHNE